MVIDFHTHIYPDKIAEKTIKALSTVNESLRTFSDGTISGLIESMKKNGVDKSVILPVATRKGQFDTINRFAKNINDNYSELISFGGIHPDDDDIPEKLKFLKDSGFKGIKIHPDYTGTMIDDERYINIITECVRLGLIVVSHAGVDPAFEVVHCPPQKARYVLDKVHSAVPDAKPLIVFAHLGGIYVYKEVEKHLIGANCYFDISCSFAALEGFCNTTDEEVVSLVKRHGADKILFATDSPWNDQKQYIDHLLSLKGLSDKEKSMILYENSEKLLNMT